MNQLSYNVLLTQREINFLVPILKLAREGIEGQEFDLVKEEMSEANKAILAASYNNWGTAITDVISKLTKIITS